VKHRIGPIVSGFLLAFLQNLVIRKTFPLFELSFVGGFQVSNIEAGWMLFERLKV